MGTYMPSQRHNVYEQSPVTQRPRRSITVDEESIFQSSIGHTLNS